jgi:hypothetical protein
MIGPCKACVGPKLLEIDLTPRRRLIETAGVEEFCPQATFGDFRLGGGVAEVLETKMR